MPWPRRHSRATQLAGAALGRILSVDQAASMLGVDRNSIRRWMGEHPATDDWDTIEELAGAQLVERMAKGLIKNPAHLATIKGIAGRNVRVRELIAERKRRHEEVPEVPIHELRRAAWRDCLTPSPWGMAENRPDTYRLYRYLNCADAVIAEEIRAELSRRAYEAAEPMGAKETSVIIREGLPPEDKRALRDKLTDRLGARDESRVPALPKGPYVADLGEGLGDVDLLGPGIFTEWLRMGETSEYDTPWIRNFLNDNYPDLKQPASDLDDAAYRAYLTELRATDQAAADEWWPSYCAGQQATHRVVRSRSGGLIQYDLNGRERVRGGELAPELEGIAIEDEAPESAVYAQEPTAEAADALDPAPIPIGRAPSRPAAVPMVVDIGGRDGSGDGPWYDIDTGERRVPRW